jgi:hypothetical protein
MRRFFFLLRKVLKQKGIDNDSIASCCLFIEEFINIKITAYLAKNKNSIATSIINRSTSYYY